MKLKGRKEIRAAVKRWLEIFGWDWKTEAVCADPTNKKNPLDRDNVSCIQIVQEEHLLKIWFNTKVLEKGEKITEEVVLHELMHKPSTATRDMVKAMFDENAEAWKAYEDAQEKMVDEYAYLILRAYNAGKKRRKK